MAKIKVNAALQRIAILEKEGYVSRAIVYSKISGDEVLEFASMNSGINQGQLSAAMHAIVQEFRNHLLTGHSVELPGVGIFRIGVNSKMVETPEDVSVSNITRRKIHFLPSTNIKALLNRVSFTTTGDAEDDSDDETGEGGTNADSDSQSGNGSGNGSSSQSNTVEAPVISGTTPFSDTTSMTISGPTGATIYYTTDGSTPTSASTEYSSAVTLSATTTVKAIAINNGVSSSVSTKTFTKSEGGNDDPDNGME
ncbi:MAG: chitobiase/beta-hexosaminidase C-terminal domain-containing protein [Bacteroidaceae bacterium]|nr:chitobiase/beta-hexosaminidase C-terminal domain-containing protein [Bacteroidaceae bacterium]